MVDKILNIKEIIQSQQSLISYNSFNCTIKHKQLVYQAFSNLLEKYPQQLTEYLTTSKVHYGFQHLIFQEYVNLLEQSLPFTITKYKKNIVIDNLLDLNLHIFDGISTFEGQIINNQIKNETKEFYIGGRAGTYAKPYYIGKLLSIDNLLDKVKSYSFNKILIDAPDQSVRVSHLRIPPHYQMGGMVHINRIKKAISEAIKF